MFINMPREDWEPDPDDLGDLDADTPETYMDGDDMTGNAGCTRTPPNESAAPPVEPSRFGPGDLQPWAELYATKYNIPVLPLYTAVDGHCTCPAGPDCLKSPAKHPATAHGLKDATTDPTKVAQWVWLCRNIGAVMGNGLLCLDIDGPSHVKNPGDPTGLESFARLEADHTPLARTWSQRTGSGGRQMFLRSPPGVRIKSTNDKLKAAGYPGIDVKGEGGYAILPPSRNLAGPYEWEPGCAPWQCAIAEIPACLLSLLEIETTTDEKKAKAPDQDTSKDAQKDKPASDDRADAKAGTNDHPNKDRQRSAPQDGSADDGVDGKAKAAPDCTTYERQADGRIDVIKAYNIKVHPGKVLERGGYTSADNGRYRRPNGDSGSIVILPPDDKHSWPRSYHHSQGDPLCDGHAHGSFDILCRLEHQGNVKASIKAAATEVGIDEMKDSRTTRDSTAQQYDSLNDVPANDALADLIIDWSKQKQTKPPEWIISGVLPAKGEAMMIAQPKAGKSTVATDMALCIATGRPWMGRELKRGRVLYIALEAESDLMIRVAAWLKHHCANEADIAQTWRVWDASRRKLDLSRFSDAALLVGAIKAAFGGDLPILIVIDTLSRARGNLDENSQEMQVLFNLVAGIKDAIKATVLLIHHEGKDPTKGARGSNVSPASQDVMIRVVNKEKKGCWVECSDMRSTKKFDPIPFEIKSIDLPEVETPVGVAVSTAVEGALSKGEVITLRALFQLLQYPGTDKHPKGPYRKELAQRAKDLGLSLREFNDGIRDLANRNPKPVVYERDGMGVRYSLTEDGRKMLSEHRDYQTAASN